MTSKRKIIIFLSGIFFIYTLFFSGFIYYSISKYSYVDFFKRLELRAITSAKIELEFLEADSGAFTIEDFSQRYIERLPEEQSFIYPWSKDSAKAISRDLGLPVSFVKNIVKNGVANTNINKVFYSGVLYKYLGKEYISVISAENYYSTHHTVYLKKILWIALIVAAATILFTVILFTRKVINPIQKITNALKIISTENMHLRLDQPKNNEDLMVLVDSLNDMLNRLETSFETQKNFISNASHELNTPLTTIIGEADLALSRDRQEEEYIEALQNILSEAEKLDVKTKALLQIAQTGYNGKNITFDVLRVDEVLLETRNTVLKINPSARINFNFELLPEAAEKLDIMGSASLLQMAFSNLMLNACKYSNNQEVNVSLGVEQNHLKVAISDSGIGIPQAEMPYIYDPFFRASNTSKYNGYGIGLPLARNVIRLHNGTLQVVSEESVGTLVSISLPSLAIN